MAWLAGSAGCYKATFHRDPQLVSGEQHEEWTNFYLFGLVGEEVIDVKRYCPIDKLAMVRTGANLGTGVVSFITLGIYTPHKIYVTCAAPSDRRANAALSSVGTKKEDAQ
jgi:hypothetical protein